VGRPLRVGSSEIRCRRANLKSTSGVRWCRSCWYGSRGNAPKNEPAEHASREDRLAYTNRWHGPPVLHARMVLRPVVRRLALQETIKHTSVQESVTAITDTTPVAQR
jgi:hypothetical protein